MVMSVTVRATYETVALAVAVAMGRLAVKISIVEAMLVELVAGSLSIALAADELGEYCRHVFPILNCITSLGQEGSIVC